MSAQANLETIMSPPASAVAPEPAPQPVKALDPPKQRLNILMVDDVPAKLTTHEAVLAELDENVIKASSGREALEYLLKQEFAVILLDVNMPEMDGFETARMIRQRPKFEHTPILFLTAYNTSDLDRLRAYDIGAADYLFLPIVPEVLKAKVRVVVQLARQKQIIEEQAEALTEHNRRQQEQIQTIQLLNEKLTSMNQELETFSYSVSHDLRSPLRAMQGYANLLLEDFKGKLAPEAEEFLNRISKAALRMDALIQDVLAYSRITKSEIPLSSIDIESLLRDLIRENRNITRTGARVKIINPLHPVIGHEPCLIQCFSNLLENSLKFVPAGTTPEITIRSDLRNGRARIWVEDNGIGIDPTHHSRLFTMFGRVHHEKSYEGTGMGLSIVKKAVERMAGTVGVESVLGHGSRFWIELAAADKAAK